VKGIDITLPLIAGRSPDLTVTATSHGYPTSNYGLVIAGNSVRRSLTCPHTNTCDWNLPGLTSPPASEGFELAQAWDSTGERIRFEGGKGNLADGARCSVTIHY